MKKRSIDTFDPCALVVRNIFLARTPSRCTYNRKSAGKQVFPLPNNKGFLLFPIIFNCPAMSAGAVTTATAGTCNAMFLSLSVILLLVTLISAIIILFFFLVHCRRKLNSTRESLVRYINIYLSVKDFVPSDKRPVVNKMKDPVTSEEFIQIINRMLKRMMLVPLFILSALSVSAQSDMREAASPDSLYEFRFKPGNDMFFGVFKENEAQLKALSELVDYYRSSIEAGTIPLHVDGYCRSMGTDEENLRTARIRASRVKSELIVRKRLTEDCFITKLHASDGEFVTVRIVVPAHDASPAEKVVAVETDAMPMTEANSDNGEIVLPEKAVTDVATATAVTAVPVSCGGNGIPRLALRANLLRWATLTPDLGVEWRISRNVGILVNGSWTSWSWNNKNRRYALWKISPEVRYYIGKEKRGYLGAMYHIGEFNYKLGGTGKQGDYQGGGITGGWQLPLNRSLSLDFHAALGYTYADYDKYNVTEGVRVRQGSDSKNYWGINQFGVTLVWKFIK